MADEFDASKPEPAPRKEEGDVWQEVMGDMEGRRGFGINKYGTPLQAHNGRDSLVDAYQEALDLVVYLRQLIIERRDAADPTWQDRRIKHLEMAVNQARFERRQAEDALVAFKEASS